MEIKFFKPKSKILQHYIEGYYFLANKKSEPIVEYFTFPNNFSIVTVMENAEIFYSENEGKVKESDGKKIVSDLICHYKKPIKLSYEGNINEITFYFKPLGLNAFLEKPLYNYTNDFFSSFIPYDDYLHTFKAILKETNLEKKCDVIEAYWLSKLIGFEHQFLGQAVHDLQNIECNYSISDLAKKYKTSRQNLRNQFELYLCKSPSDFKLIHRFRLAYNLQIKNSKKGTLTNLSYETLFYDQSHLIKDFKSLTGYNPKAFFKNISHLEEGNINWMFL